MTNETVKIKIQTENSAPEAGADSDEVNWRIEEPGLTPKTTEWFWAFGILAFALIVFSVLLKNYLLIIILALAIFVMYSSKNKKPELINFRLNNNGLYIEHQFYPYDSFESYWIFPDENGSSPNKPASALDRETCAGGKTRELALRHKQRLSPLLIISFYGGDEPKIKKIINKYLPEKEEQESLMNLLRKKFF